MSTVNYESSSAAAAAAEAAVVSLRFARPVEVARLFRTLP